MGVRRESKHEVIEALRRRYRGAGRAEKGRLSDEAMAVTGYHRRYAQALLRKGVPYGGPRLATHGYGPHDGSTVYYPLYPLLIKLVAWPLGGNDMLAALVVSNLCFAVLLVALHGLVAARHGEAAARRTLLLLCQAEQLTLTRCRASHKNDQAHVEQKNWSVGRHLVGYDRYEGAEAVAALEGVYALLHLYVKGYLPVMKLVGNWWARSGTGRGGASTTMSPRRPIAERRRRACSGLTHRRRGGHNWRPLVPCACDVRLTRRWPRRGRGGWGPRPPPAKARSGRL